MLLYLNRNTPLDLILLFLSPRWFQQIKRYLHISRAESDKLNKQDQPDNWRWWYKNVPLASEFQTLFLGCHIPSTWEEIDGLMIRYFGRSINTYKMPNKPIKQGYKVFGIVDYWYINSWFWSSKWLGVEEIDIFEALTNTWSFVRALTTTLSRRHMAIYKWTITSYLYTFLELTTRWIWSIWFNSTTYGISKTFSQLKKDNSKLEWGFLSAHVIDNTLCYAS